jgi:hypothetical protein
VFKTHGSWKENSKRLAIEEAHGMDPKYLCKMTVRWPAEEVSKMQSRSQSMPVRWLGSGMTLGKSNLFYPK